MFGPRGKWPAWEHAGRIPFACRKGLLSLGFWKQCVPSVLMDCKLPCTRCPFPRITDCISSALLCLLGWRGRWNVNFLQGISYERWWSLCFLHHLSASSQSSSSLLTWTQPLQTSFDSSCKLVLFTISLCLEFVSAMSSSFFSGLLLRLETPAVGSLGWFSLYCTSLL